MKTCVFIMGTNATGKTSVARETIRILGGIVREEQTSGGKVSVVTGDKIVFAGRYLNVKFGGVDNYNTTGTLALVAADVLARYDALVCEGMYMGTFGKNLTSTIYQADARLVVCLMADRETINARLMGRSGRRASQAAFDKQGQCINAANKYGRNGCAVFFRDSTKLTPTEIAQEIAQWITAKVAM